MGAFDAIQPLSAVRPERRPEPDPAPVQAAAVQTAHLSGDARVETAIASVDETWVLPHSAVSLTPEALSSGPTPPTSSTLDIAMKAAEPGAAGSRLTGLGDTWSLATVPQNNDKVEKQAASAAKAENVVLPYGPDPERVRHLIDWFISRNEFLPITFAYRQAGDLRETVSVRSSTKGIVSVGAVKDLYRSD
ncbi:hypothetical protein Sa4125_28480 [Aureimonas sp. SA4125]|uniref:hypothetical protein n=1 Tax=Aureimonas sp. SA4125 TaxID=2826993 RepID=UPI001CC6B0E9|nr:hypothetical protein [Aureimonas sp. SA4125]BDA85306.1 hypothetical protein Sa4125_28480 [Aureimonas sp. SA4125]